MRLFLNILYEFKKTDKLSDILEQICAVLEENHWTQQRILFHLCDISEATSEGRTPHHALLKAHPQIAPYWTRSIPYPQSSVTQSIHLFPGQEEPAPTEHFDGYLTNFPGRKNGQPVFFPSDPAIDLSLIHDIFAKIPRPYTFYSSVALLDGIDWFGSCDLSPMMDWIILGRSREEDWEPGDWPNGMDFDEPCPFYQSNSVRIGKDWGATPEVAVQVEILPGQEPALAKRVEDAFAKRLGTPSKRYTRAVYSWSEQEDCFEANRKMDEFFLAWSKKLHMESEKKYVTQKHAPTHKKTLSRATMKKHFYTANKLEHYPLSRWDDKQCWCKELAHHYHLQVGLVMNPKPPQPGKFPVERNALYIECIGCNFELRDHLELKDFPADKDADTAASCAFEIWQDYLDRFETEVVPKLFALYGDTPPEFVYDSQKFNRANDQTIGEKYIRF